MTGATVRSKAAQPGRATDTPGLWLGGVNDAAD
jgi:hypothetical protein